MPQGGKLFLWRVALGGEVRRPILSEDELARASRFRLDEQRKDYLVRQAALRDILGRHLNADPKTLQFAHGSNGKPYLKDHDGLWFNLAHSHRLALVAVSECGEVGVDLEYLRDLPDMLDVARAVFTPREVADLTALSGNARIEAFYRLWCAKEAFLKAIGSGFTDEPLPADPTAWHTLALSPLTGYVGSVVIEREPQACLWLDW